MGKKSEAFTFEKKIEMSMILLPTEG